MFPGFGPVTGSGLGNPVSLGVASGWDSAQDSGFIAARYSPMEKGPFQPAGFLQRLGRARWLEPLVVLALLAGHMALAVGSLRNKSATFDEIVHVTGAYTYWIEGSYSINPENGILPQRIAGLALLGKAYSLPGLPDPDRLVHEEHWSIAHRFLYCAGNDADEILFRARCAMVAVSMLLCLAVYGFSRKHFGRAGGLISLALCTLSPTVLAHGRLVTSDVTAGLCFLLSAGCFWSMLHRLSWWSLAASCAAMGAAVLSKMSGPMVMILAVVMVLVWLLGKRGMRISIGQKREVTQRGKKTLLGCGILLVHALAVFVLIWAAYGFRYRSEGGTGETRLARSWDLLQSTRGPAIQQAGEAHLLPEAYLFGLDYVLNNAQRRRAFMNGHWSAEGWPGFFPYAFAAKTPLAILGMILLAAAVGVRWGWKSSARLQDLRKGLYDTVPFWLLILGFGALVVTSKLNIGHRHLLPVYPALFLLCGVVGKWSAGRTWGAALPVVLLLALAGRTCWIFPDYLTHFNALAGGADRGYTHLVDSSYDWGQDLPALRRFLSRRVPGTPAYLCYFGSASPEWHGVEALFLPGYMPLFRIPFIQDPGPGTYCISATMLQGVYQDFWGPWTMNYERWYQAALAAGRREMQWPLLMIARLCAYLRNRTPDERVGSILIYHLEQTHLREALLGPPPVETVH